jgi:Protein of unknown function (DUF2505)
VRFQIEQRFTANANEVLRALISEKYLREGMAKLPDISEPDVVQHSTANAIRNVLKFHFGGHLPSVVTTVVDPKKLSWVEDTHIDLTQRTASFTITPAHYANFFGCRGSWTIIPNGASSTRLIEGIMKVSSPIPFVNGQVERAIVSGLRERLVLEPAILDSWLTENPH